MTLQSNARSLQNAWQSLSVSERPDGRGAVYAFFAGQSGCGTSWVVRNMAHIAALKPAGAMGTNRRVLIVDMDLQNSAQAGWFFSPEGVARYGQPQGPYDAAFGMEPFWRVTPAMTGADGLPLNNGNFMSLHTTPYANLAFTLFHWEKFLPGQNVHILNARAYWHELRSQFSTILIDLPALDRTDILGSVCPEVDSTILVSAAASVNAPENGQAHRRILETNGRCAGMILNERPTHNLAHGGKQW